MDIGLALSGGGTRAATFHLGVLRRLADAHLLGSVSQLSTVSGGSLLVAAIVSRFGWPTDGEFASTVYPAMRELLTGHDLLSVRALGLRGLVRFNFRLLRGRSEILAALLERNWGVRGSLEDIPDRPLWWINATCVETGKNWRFSKREMGDWSFGRHYEPKVKIADAVAASAAVPYVLGAKRFVVPPDGWYRTDPARRSRIARQAPPFSEVRLWDGGAYENLGLEPLFKPRIGLIGCDFLICSDASSPVQVGSWRSPLSIAVGKLGSPRLFDIASDQIRSLRSRMLISSIERGEIQGALLRIGNSVQAVDTKARRNRDPVEYDRFLSDEAVMMAARHETDLRAMPLDVFDRIARHGYEVADSTLTTYAPEKF